LPIEARGLLQVEGVRLGVLLYSPPQPKDEDGSWFGYNKTRLRIAYEQSEA